MKKVLIVIAICIGLYLLSQCSHHHEWSDATCSTPKTCVDCGETVGNTLEHTWDAATCKSPKRCSVCDETEGTTSGHSWVGATCSKPKYCSICGITEGTVLEHSWIPATCESAKHCPVCGKSEGQRLEHNWVEATYTTPKTCLSCGKMEALPLPQSGEAFIGAYSYRSSSLTIKSSSDKACYVKLKNTAGEDVFSFFVRAGDSVTVYVPAGNSYVYFSYGSDWYGTEHLFGSSTTYAKDNELCDFTNYSYTYTLYPSVGGNFSETPVSADEFK